MDIERNPEFELLDIHFLVVKSGVSRRCCPDFCCKVLVEQLPRRDVVVVVASV